MARLSTLGLFCIILVLICYVPSLEARKLMNIERRRIVPSPEDNLVLTALPKGTAVPSSSPSGKGPAMVIYEKLLSQHFSRIDRILESNPSPGIGNRN
ncbi:precursor of CEP14-like [Cornus florida]|uniref:precursor of CEP14-like n=1 Tax=Cornus florida TaxID=4283 RepID=UPI002896459D|nr:precursor of CEP14-like [Cornus florida]